MRSILLGNSLGVIAEHLLQLARLWPSVSQIARTRTRITLFDKRLICSEVWVAVTSKVWRDSGRASFSPPHSKRQKEEALFVGCCNQNLPHSLKYHANVNTNTLFEIFKPSLCGKNMLRVMWTTIVLKKKYIDDQSIVRFFNIIAKWYHGESRKFAEPNKRHARLHSFHRPRYVSLLYCSCVIEMRSNYVT